MNYIHISHWSYWWSGKVFDNEKGKHHDHFQEGEEGRFGKLQVGRFTGNYVQTLEGQKGVWEKPMWIYQRQIVPDQSDCFLWWNEWFSGEGKKSVFSLPTLTLARLLRWTSILALSLEAHWRNMAWMHGLLTECGIGWTDGFIALWLVIQNPTD